MKLSDPAHLTVGGEFAERLDRAIRHLQALNTAEMRRELTAPTTQWHWGADYLSRWLGTMALLGAHMHEDYGAAAVAAELIGFQQPDGSFGSFHSGHDYQEWFGMGRALVGLLDYYTATADAAALAAARRLGDYYAAQYPYAADFMRECYASGLEGLVRLAEVTGEASYLATARRVAEASPVFAREWMSSTLGERNRRAPCGGQVHCQLSTARGLLELHRLTGEQPYLDAVLALHTFVVREALWLSGGVGFYFNRPEENETCADADWVRLNLALWHTLGDKHYLDLAEHALVNQLYFAQAGSGGFCYLRGLQGRAGATFDVCCSHHGPRAMWEVLRYVYTTEAHGVWVNLLLDGVARLSLDGATMEVATAVHYKSYAVVLMVRVITPPPFPVAINVRVPGWAGGVSVEVRGRKVEVGQQHGYVRLNRVWRTGEVLEVRYPREVRVRHGHRLGEHVLNAHEAAVQYGPQVYCASDLWNPTLALHLLRVKWPAGPRSKAFVADQLNRLETEAIDASGNPVRLTLAPLAEVAGMANGIGRSHPVSTSPFRVWLPLAEAEAQ